MGILSFLGIKSKSEKVKEFLVQKAAIIDVRTPAEFRQGHLKNSKNIPLDKINSSISKLKKNDQPIITVCRSGARSARAAAILKSEGIKTMNGGAWNSLSKYVH